MSRQADSVTSLSICHRDPLEQQEVALLPGPPLSDQGCPGLTPCVLWLSVETWVLHSPYHVGLIQLCC